MPGGSYSICDTQGFLKITKKHETITDNPLVQIYANKIKNKIVFKIKASYKLELLSSKTMKSLRLSKKEID